MGSCKVVKRINKLLMHLRGLPFLDKSSTFYCNRSHLTRLIWHLYRRGHRRSFKWTVMLRNWVSSLSRKYQMPKSRLKIGHIQMRIGQASPLQNQRVAMRYNSLNIRACRWRIFRPWQTRQTVQQWLLVNLLRTVSKSSINRSSSHRMA